jgi:signal peptidase I
MRTTSRWAVLIALLTLVFGALPAAADHSERPHTNNMHAQGHSPNPASFFNVTPETPFEINTDIAFWGKYAFNGNYDGFRIIDIKAPGNPKEIVHQRCEGNQGDIVVYEHILVRSWNSPAPAGVECDGQPVPEGFEGLHVFDISDLTDPELVASVELECGSHTATLAPDLDNDRLIVYSNVSSGCDWIDIVEVPLDDPAAAALLRMEELVGGSLGSNNGCHDMGVILGDVNLAACASGHAANVFDIGDNDLPGGSLEDPVFLYSIEETDEFGNQVGVGGRWHSAAFTWDGEVLALGWEPGGGAAGECEADDPDIRKSLFFYDAQTGEKLGQWTLPRPQEEVENCTIHNYNIVPMRDGSYIVVMGNYQAGTWVVDFSDPANPETIAWSDPLPLDPEDLGGAWSSYWYNGRIYESSITEGLNVFRVSDKALAKSIRLDHLNPQTQEFSLP